MVKDFLRKLIGRKTTGFGDAIIKIEDYDAVNYYCMLIANDLFPKVRDDVEKGFTPATIYATLLARSNWRGEVDRESVMWGAFVTCIAVAHRLQAEEKAGRLAT